MKKIISLLMVIVISAACLCSCQKDDGTFSLKPSPAGTLKVANGNISVSSFVKIDGVEISYDLFRYCYLAQKAEMEEANDKIDWQKKENADILLESALEEVKYFVTIEKLAKKYGYKITEEIQADIDDTIKSAMDQCDSTEEYERILKEAFLTQTVYEDVLAINALAEKLQETLVGTDKKTNKITFTFEEALKAYKEDYVHLADIFFTVVVADEEGNALSDEQIEKNTAETKKKAEAARKKLETMSFEDLMKEYEVDETQEKVLEGSESGYHDMRSLSNLLNYDLGKLKEGEVTEVIQSSGSFFIIKKLAMDDEYLKKNSAETINTYYVSRKFSDTIQETMDALKVEKTEHYNKISVETLV